MIRNDKKLRPLYHYCHRRIVEEIFFGEGNFLREQKLINRFLKEGYLILDK